MLAWHVPYLGWIRLPADLSEFEITHFFSLRPEDRGAILTRYRDSLRLGAALQIGFLKMCGRPLDAVQRVPADLLKRLGEQLDVAAPTIATLRALYLKRRRTLYEHQRWAWAAFSVDPGSLSARQAAEAQLLWEIRQGLRRGSLYVPHSLAYRDKQVQFDTKGTTVRAPGSERPLPEQLDQLFANIEVGLEHLEEAVWFEHLKIEGTKVHQHPLAAQENPPDLEFVREELYGSLPSVHLPELIMAMDSEIRISWILLGREPANEQELLYVYSALLGHAMDLNANRLSLMTPGLSVEGILSALQLLEDGAAMRRANAAAVEFLHSHPLTAAWGRPEDCAGDAMSLDTSRHIWIARTDPKRRNLSTASYVHTLGRHGIGYDQPIATTVRQQGAAIEGALRQTVAPFSVGHGAFQTAGI